MQLEKSPRRLLLGSQKKMIGGGGGGWWLWMMDAPAHDRLTPGNKRYFPLHGDFIRKDSKMLKLKGYCLPFWPIRFTRVECYKTVPTSLRECLYTFSWFLLLFYPVNWPQWEESWWKHWISSEWWRISVECSLGVYGGNLSMLIQSGNWNATMWPMGQADNRCKSNI